MRRSVTDKQFREAMTHARKLAVADGHWLQVRCLTHGLDLTTAEGECAGVQGDARCPVGDLSCEDRWTYAMRTLPKEETDV
jgi:hypothetical protein